LHNSLIISNFAKVLQDNKYATGQNYNKNFRTAKHAEIEFQKKLLTLRPKNYKKQCKNLKINGTND